MLADELDYVIGVDTHRDWHALAVVAAPSGGVVVVEPSLSACPDGYRRALALADAHAPGARVFAVEGAGSYGAGLARFLAEQGERVLEVERPTRRGGSPRGKTDTLDAVRGARGLLGADKPAQPRADGERAALQALLRVREGALTARRAALCQLRNLIVTAPAPLREQLRSLTRARLLRRCAALRPGRGDQRGIRLALRLLARRIQLLTDEERALAREITVLVEQLAPTLLAQPGVGPISAGQLIASWSHPGRIHSEAAFARLAGAPPIPASSGLTIRHRLDRGGDRQLNRALHTIIVSRRKHHQPTINYIERRTNEGKTTREAIRSLKRFLARNLYKLLEATPQTP